ncbi:MAG: hypothetical protein ACLTV6_14210 [Christensenellales bacterium]
MRSNRMKNTSPPRRKRSAIKRVKPQRGTLPLLITLSVFVVAMIFFAPKIAQTPAANVSGTEVDEAAVSSGDTNLRITEAMSSNRSASRMRRARSRIGWKSPTRATAPSTSRATAFPTVRTKSLSSSRI